jgi:dCTP deaminase
VQTGELIAGDRLVQLIQRRELLVEPILDQASQLTATGIDIRLDTLFREFVRTQRPYLTPAQAASEGTVLRELEPFRHSFFLQPGEFALAQSYEYIALPITAYGLLNGRSSLGRRGLIVHATANFVDPGWRGHLVFELANLGTMPIQLFPLMRVAKLIFFETTPTRGYAGSYRGQMRIKAPEADLLCEKLFKMLPSQSQPMKVGTNSIQTDHVGK